MDIIGNKISLHGINLPKNVFFSATDYPPTADAGSNVIISLPQKSVTLYGNSSTDDKKIVSYEWTRTSDDKLAVDMVVSILYYLHFYYLFFSTANSNILWSVIDEV